MSHMVSPSTILITGATGGIGGALALAYAETGKTLILQGRNSQRLNELVNECQALGARVVTGVVDVRQIEELSIWLKSVFSQQEIDLVILNAGVNTHIGLDGAGESWDAVKAVIETNVLSVMAATNIILPFMRVRGKGQIALISSLAAYVGLPITPSYCASKAAIKVYGEALRVGLSSEGIQVNVVMPGYVESEMCRQMPGPKPFLWTADKAARVIKKGLAHNQARISFPFPLNFGTWWLSVFPSALTGWILRVLNYVG